MFSIIKQIIKISCINKLYKYKITIYKNDERILLNPWHKKRFQRRRNCSKLQEKSPQMASQIRKRRSINFLSSFLINFVSIRSPQRPNQKSILRQVWMGKAERRTFCVRWTQRRLSIRKQSGLNFWKVLLISQCVFKNHWQRNFIKRVFVQSCIWSLELQRK